MSISWGHRRRLLFCWMSVMLACSGASWAVNPPVRSSSDERVGYVDYKADDVVPVLTARGVVTRIVLAEGELISRPVETGFPSNCDESSHEWCIHADVGQNQITTKPRSTFAAQNNMEVSTNKRDYSFVLTPIKGGDERAKGVFYRIIFRYPMPPVPMPVQALADSVDSGRKGKKALPASKYISPTVRNVDYAFKAEGPSRSLLPSVVFDDGRFTYFKFERAREIPAVFATDAKGEEIRVAFHAERLLADPQNPQAEVERDYLVLNRVSPMWRLRIEELVAEVINNKYDAAGIETYNGTTVPTMRRESK